MSHSYVDPRLRGLTYLFVVFAQATTPAEPCECSLDHPSERQDIELATVPWTPHDFKPPSCQAPYPLDQLSTIARVSPDQAQTLKPTLQFTDNQLRSISVLNVCRMNHHIQQQSCGIYYDVSLSTIYLFACVLAARAPFSVVLADWLSMIAALGSGLLPSDSRTAGRNSSCTRSHVPSRVHPRKYSCAVCQGGRSSGSIRQAQPLRSVYRIPLTISRRSTERGRPPLLAVGSRGARTSHCSSVRSLG